MLLSILIIITLNSVSDKLLASFSFSSSGEFACSFICGLFLLSSHYGCLFVFVSMYLVDLQTLVQLMSDTACDWLCQPVWNYQ